MINYSKLNKKSILEEDVFIEIYEEKDVIQQAAMICTLSDMAKEFGVKQNFDRMLKAFSKSKRQYNNANGGGKTNFTGDYLDLNCGGWICDDSGITILTQFGEKTACSHPILPVKTLINAETGYCKSVLAFKVRNRWKEIVVDKEVLASNNRIVQLSKHGVRVTSENARALVQYLADIEAMNEKYIQEQISTSKLGWLKSRFIPYDESVIFDNDDALSGAFKSIQEHGSYMKWLELVKKIRAGDRKEPGLYLAGSFASILLTKFNALPFIVSIFGKTGKGKTVALMLATSIWADPSEGKYFVRAKATDIALEVRLDFLNHLPLAVDDMTQIQKRVKDDFADYVYTLCSGGGKERSNVNIGLQRQRSWDNIILTNSERSLISETMNGGAINRIIEIESEEGNIFESGSEIVDIIKENYGYAGKEFVEIITDMQGSNLKDIQKEFIDKIYAKQFEMGEEKEEKQIIPMSILLTADKIATDYIFEDGVYLDFDFCYSLLKSKSDVSDDERAYEFILSDIDMHRNNFVPDTWGNYKGEVWGMFEDGYAFINNNAFNSICERGNISAKSFLTWASKKRLLMSSDEKNRDRTTKSKRINGKVTRCVVLKMDTVDCEESNVNIDNTGFRKLDDKERTPFVTQ